MTKEDKLLLLKDLCMRLPYNTRLIITGKECVYKGILTTSTIQHFDDWDVKPYLRPMSSMTEEEKSEFIKCAGYEVEESVNGRHYEYYLKDFCGTIDNPSVNTDGVDWLNANHFDYRELIPKGLAIEVTEENNPYGSTKL